jgi:hypothetical protein
VVALVEPDEEEKYLLAILDSPDGIDLAEFAMNDNRNSDGCYRLYDYQWAWFSCSDMYQIDMGGRNLGKTESIKLRAVAFPFVHTGESMLLTAPELNHLRPLTDEIEKMLLSTRIVREMMPGGKGAGIARQPHWQCRFRNGSSIISRLPNKDGKGVKSQHVINLEMDECFPAGTLVTTRRGQVPIEQVVVGDEVVTHRNRYRTVTDTMVRERATVVVRGQGHPGLTCSVNHKFWAMAVDRRLVLTPEGLRKERVFVPPEFIPARNLEGAFWSSPTTWPKTQTLSIPSFAGRGRQTAPYAPSVDVHDPDWFWLVGLYLAEGSIWRDDQHGHLRIHLSIHQDEAEEVILRLKRVGLSPAGPYPIKDGKGVNVTLYHSQKQDLTEIAAWLERHFRRFSHGMSIPTWALGMPAEHRTALLEGLLFGDGFQCRDERYTSERHKLTTVSKSLAVTSRLLGLSLGWSVSLYWNDLRDRVATIRGREIRSDGFYQVVFARSGQGHVYQSQRFTGVREVTDTGRVEQLYDLTVEQDHSFIADGIIVSNSQDYPLAGWREVVETLNAGQDGAMWRCHGVSRGVRDSFFEKTQPGSGWTVHRPMAMNRPTWSKAERDAKIIEYGGSRQSVDYKRNIYGEHGDASSSVFVLAKLMGVVDVDEGSTYNSDVYTCIKMDLERFTQAAANSDDERTALIHSWIDVPGEHFHGYNQRVGNTQVGAPTGYSAYWGGMDVGVTNHPSEILIFGQRAGSEFLELLTRVQMRRINTDDQMLVVTRLFALYGDRLRFGIDKTGVGFPIWDQLTRREFGDRVYGFGFSEKRVAGFEERDLQPGETQKDLARYRNVVEAATDWLRNDHVDVKRFRLPYDREVLMEFQGQSYSTVRDNGDPYGVRRQYSGGSFHSLDAAKVAIATKYIPPLEALLDAKPTQTPVLDVFMGA